jgi:hypothetical protein
LILWWLLLLLLLLGDESGEGGMELRDGEVRVVVGLTCFPFVSR